MTTSSQPHQPSRQSILHRALHGQGKTSPEQTRQSFMFTASVAASCLAIYATAIADGAGGGRLLLAVLAAGWMALTFHTARSASAARRL